MNQYILSGLVILATHSATFYAGMRHEESNQIRIELISEKAAKTASDTAAKAISEIEIKQTVINNKVREIIKTETIYSECKHSPDMYKLILEKFK